MLIQHYFSHITATAGIIHAFPGFHQYYAGAQKYLLQGHSHEKHNGSSDTQTWDLKVKSHIAGSFGPTVELPELE